jgi:hypothetical protein
MLLGMLLSSTKNSRWRPAVRSLSAACALPAR